MIILPCHSALNTTSTNRLSTPNRPHVAGAECENHLPVADFHGEFLIQRMSLINLYSSYYGERCLSVCPWEYFMSEITQWI